MPGMGPSILIVDDDTGVLGVYQEYLGQRFALDTALSGAQALDLVQTRGPYAVVVADKNMPEMNGIEFLERCSLIAPDMVRLMLTGDADIQAAIDAINKGHISQFLAKPCPPEVFLAAIDTAVKQHKSAVSEREVLEKTLSGTIKMLTEILSLVEAHSFGESEKIRDYTRVVARALRISEFWEIEAAAMLSQIGFVTVPASIIEKIRHNLTLQTNEKFILERVPEIGSRLLSNIPRLEAVARIILYQNKNFDGTGFPTDSIGGEKIPLGARILRVVADLVRLEAEGIGRHAAFEQMKSFPGRYDAKVLTAATVSLLIHLNKGPKRQGKPVTLQELVVGQIVAERIETDQGLKILGASTVISPMILEKLHNFSQLGTVKEPIYVEV